MVTNSKIQNVPGVSVTAAACTLTGTPGDDTLVFESYDHFGLETDGHPYAPLFTGRFALQHHDRYDGKYVPPIAIATLEVDIHGEF